MISPVTGDDFCSRPAVKYEWEFSVSGSSMLAMPASAAFTRCERIVCLLLILMVLPLAAQTTLPTSTNWLPVSDAERNLKSPKIDPNAGVEALFWRVYVLDEFQGGQDHRRVLDHYVRLKVFTDKGKDIASTIDLSFGGHTSILYVTGRTIKPDGGILELKNDAVYERDVVRAGGIKRKVKSFAMPGVEVGAIVEYRWREVQFNVPIRYIRLPMQREYPVHKVTYFIKPLPSEYTAGYFMSVLPFNCKPSPLKLESDGFNSTTLENVPAYREEPMMPGDGNVRPWVLAFYHTDTKRTPEKYWNEIGKQAYSELRTALKVNGEIKAASQEAISGAPNDGEKALALLRYLRRHVRGLFDTGVSDAERAAVLKRLSDGHTRTSEEVFRTRLGTPDELNTLFAAMASATGLEARPVLIADRNDVAFDPALAAEAYFLPNIDMAVRIGDDWRLFDVSARHLPANMLEWQEEGVKALLSDPKNPTFVMSPVSPPEASGSDRKGRFALSSDGTLEGDVDESYRGYSAESLRNELEDQDPARQQDNLKEKLARTFPQAEMTSIKIEGVEDPEVAMTIRYHLKIPNYAQRTGRRILFAPLLFERGDPPLFEAAERRYPIFFPYAFREADNLVIKLPDGFVLDNAENPGSVAFGKPGGYKLELATTPNRELLAHRELVWGREGVLYFGQETYPQLKQAFDIVHNRDGVTLSLRMEGQ
jgi:Domain of Unknown Function with PDB structure (DUF3857)